MELIADGLASNSSLLCLDLSDNKIGSAGALALAEALHSNKTLAELQLSNNRIGAQVAGVL
jgi:Ran GTPase-activating protein (RanGAP) involved in mRNA processing and transport